MPRILRSTGSGLLFDGGHYNGACRTPQFALRRGVGILRLQIRRARPAVSRVVSAPQTSSSIRVVFAYASSDAAGLSAKEEVPCARENLPGPS